MVRLQIAWRRYSKTVCNLYRTQRDYGVTPSLPWCTCGDDEKTEHGGFDMAVDAGSFHIPFAKDKRIVVFEIKCSDKYIDEDSSGVNMESLGAVQTHDVPKNCIQQYWISEDLSLLSPFILKEMTSPGYTGLAKQLSKLEQYVIQHIPNDFSFYIGDMPITWTNTQLKNHGRQNTRDANLIRA